MAYNDGPLAAARREVAVRAAAHAARPADLLRKSGSGAPAMVGGIPIVFAILLPADHLDAESAWKQHIPFAFWLVRSHAPSISVELVSRRRSTDTFLSRSPRVEKARRAQCGADPSTNGSFCAVGIDMGEPKVSHIDALVHSTASYLLAGLHLLNTVAILGSQEFIEMSLDPNAIPGLSKIKNIPSEIENVATNAIERYYSHAMSKIEATRPIH